MAAAGAGAPAEADAAALAAVLGLRPGAAVAAGAAAGAAAAARTDFVRKMIERLAKKHLKNAFVVAVAADGSLSLLGSAPDAQLAGDLAVDGAQQVRSIAAYDMRVVDERVARAALRRVVAVLSGMKIRRSTADGAALPGWPAGVSFRKEPSRWSLSDMVLLIRAYAAGHPAILTAPYVRWADRVHDSADGRRRAPAE